MQAIVLVGGQGTRLRSVVPDLPKPMAPLQGRPFLAYVLDYLKQQGVTSVVLPVCYMREKIESYFQSSYNGIDIQYIIEEEPLGTGGAIANVLQTRSITKPIFVLNGDTFVRLNYQEMYARHCEQQATLTMALRQMADCTRYGKVIVSDQEIISFHEKGVGGEGLINAGVYLIQPSLFAEYNMPKQFSFETDFLFPYLSKIRPRAFVAGDYFIDIGVPEDYARASVELV